MMVQKDSVQLNMRHRKRMVVIDRNVLVEYRM